MIGWALQVAAVQRWLAAPALAELVEARVFDGEAPRDAAGNLPATPYIVVGEKTTTALRALAARGGRATVTAHVWSAYAGNMEVDAVHLRMMGALEEPLDVEGFGLVRLNWEFATVLNDPSGLRHGPIRFRARAFRQP